MSDIDRGELENYVEEIREMTKEYAALAARYDDAMKRIQDMQAELEFLRREVGR